MDSVDYLAPDVIGGVDLYAYCGNNPVMYYDPTGHILVLVGILQSRLIVQKSLIRGKSNHIKGKTVSKSNISKEDININGSNANGTIKVTITDKAIQIEDSYKYTSREDMEAILTIIMESAEYKKYGYDRDINSYIAEWEGHNFVYAIDVFGLKRKQTRSVDLNRKLEDDNYWIIYVIWDWLFVW